MLILGIVGTIVFFAVVVLSAIAVVDIMTVRSSKHPRAHNKVRRWFHSNLRGGSTSSECDCERR